MEEGCMSEPRIVCHFSCGAASAVAVKLILAENPASPVAIYNAFIAEEHPDNRRFLLDCQRWFNHPVTVLRDEKFGASVHEVWRRKKFISSGIFGSLCSAMLKREVLDAVCLPDDVHVFGYTFDEKHRVEKWAKSNQEKAARFPLIERGLTHADCLGIIKGAGLELPEMYRLGYNNANCIGCCKGGEGYWNKIRRDFPETFAQVIQIQEAIGPDSYMFRNRKTGIRIGLRDLDPNAGRHSTEIPSCSFICAEAEEDIALQSPAMPVKQD
jgi:hypothetical protein